MLPQAEFFNELTTATAERLASWSGLVQALLAAARVHEIEGDVAHLEGSSPRGGSVAVDLPRALLERRRLKIGDLVWVFSRVVGDAALVELLPAIRIEMRSRTSGQDLLELRLLVDVADAPDGPAAEESDGLTPEERDEYAEQFRATVGSDLTAAELSDLQSVAAAGRLSRRRLHPAGS
jgi:antitoxin component of MazEF toxin-antitoxin module